MGLNLSLQRRAVYFSTDAFLAAMLILVGFLFIYYLSTASHDSTQLNYLSSDILVALDTIPVLSLSDPFIAVEVANGGIGNTDHSVLEQIAEYWAKNESLKAQQLTSIVMIDLIDSQVGLDVHIDSELIYQQLVSPTTTAVVSRKMISGLDKNKPLSGSSSHGYLRNIKDKEFSAYAYFGGFVGQGNISVLLEDLPADVDSSRVTKIVLQADMKINFSVLINDDSCASLTPSAGNMSADLWDITNCSVSLQSGTNEFSIHFDTINDAFVGGGFVRVDYETDEFQTSKNYSQTTYFFPDIAGIVNLYDAVHIPGVLENITVYLHYLANHSNETTNPFYFTLGNTSVYIDLNSTTDKFITLTDDTLSSMLDYSSMSATTTPLRIGFENLTYATFYTGNADVVLITDVSGSMAWNFTHDSVGVSRNCDNPSLEDLSTARLSVAKCLDKDFSFGILNVSGNRVGLVSYESSTDSQLSLTTNITLINNQVGMGVGLPQGYVASGGTCICCGINSAANILSADLQRTNIIAEQDTWLYNNSFVEGNILPDGSGNEWFETSFDDSLWSSGSAVLGYDGGVGGVAVDTDIGSSLLGAENIVDLWELSVDTASPELDFTSGLNWTANTYGIASAHDGWDWSSGTFDYAGSFTTFDVNAGRLRLRTPNSGTGDTSGAFAISINITPEQYAIMSSNGTAVLSFDYWWDDYQNYFETSDQVWVKGRWTSPFSGAHLLGEDLDTGDSHSDASVEIATSDNPDIDIVNQRYKNDIVSWIEGPGTYYLELGGKLDRSSSNEWGYFYFDNILLVARNNTDHYYFRKHFTIADITTVRKGVLNVLSDDFVSVYLNGNLLLDQSRIGLGTYWDISGFNIQQNLFSLGDNVLAVELRNTKDSARFDLELFGFNDSKDKAMMVMTDGEANVECAQQGSTPDLNGDGLVDRGEDDAIAAACEAAADYGIIIYAVGFGSGAEDDTLEPMAICGNGLYQKSDNTSELQTFYEDVVLNILDISRRSQSIVVSSGTPTNSRLYGDSYISFIHQNAVLSPSPKEIELVFETALDEQCQKTVTIPYGLRVSDAKITSYSGDHWTSLVEVDGSPVFNISVFADNYTFLGDPFLVSIPPSLLTAGNHTISYFTGDNHLNTTNCSLDNVLIYTGFVNSSTSRSTVVDKALGCNWTVDFEDGTTETFAIPEDYLGAKKCNYTSASISYDQFDAYDIAVFSLLNQLDFDDDGEVFVNLAAEDLEIFVSLVNEIPYLWGPAIVEVTLWQ